MKHERSLPPFAHLVPLLILAFGVSPLYSFTTNSLIGRPNKSLSMPRLSISILEKHSRPTLFYRTVPRGQQHAVALGTGPAERNGYDPFETANKIEPETMPLPQSLAFYAKFLVQHFVKKGVDKKALGKVKGRKRAMFEKLNEQRKNVVTLAGYTPHIAVPSFTFLLLGALMTSIVPAYYSKCIQCVSTLTATRAQLVEAVVGLGVSSTLAALLTGLRGSLFWIGGECLVPNCHLNRQKFKTHSLLL
jgi:hypothetical protein